MIATALAKDPRERYASAGDLARAALEAVDRPSLARGVSRLAAGERAPGWKFADTPLPRPRGVALPGALTAETERRSSGARRALERLRERFALAADGRAPGRAARPASPASARRGWRPSSPARRTPTGATVLYGRCDLESLVPYQPFVTARPALHRPARDADAAATSSSRSWRSSRASSPRCAARRQRDGREPARRGRARRGATGSSRRSRGCSPTPPARRRRSSSSTTCSGRTPRPRCCSPTCSATASPPASSCSARSATPTATAATS